MTHVLHCSFSVYVEVMMFVGYKLDSRPSVTGHIKTDGRDKSAFGCNCKFTLHPQEMITTETHLINARVGERERP